MKTLEQRKIRQRQTTLKKKIFTANVDLKLLQSECTHPDASKTYRGDTGNYDRSQDSFWIEHKCPDCGKFWTTDQ